MGFFCGKTVVLFILLAACDVKCLRLTDIRIPTHAVRNKEAVLECNFDLDGEDLYSVKWYKDGNEFFRYEPKRNPPGQTFPMGTIYVDERFSTENRVKLSPITLQNSGEYRCEVSADEPSFQTVQDFGNMTVVALPDEGPQITGTSKRYKLGHIVRANCTSGKSKPVADLMWLINGEEVPRHFLRGPWQDVSDSEGLERRTLGLEFKVKAKHFKGRDMKLECLATIRPVYAQGQVEILGNMPWHGPARAGHHNNHHRTTTTTTTELPDYGNANIPELETQIINASEATNATNETSTASSIPYHQNSTYITFLLIFTMLLVSHPIPDILFR